MSFSASLAVLIGAAKLVPVTAGNAIFSSPFTLTKLFIKDNILFLLC